MSLAPIFVELVGDGRKLSRTLGEAQHDIQKLSKNGASSFSKLSSVGHTAFKVIGEGALAVGVISLHMADEFEKSHARLEAAVKASGSSFDDYSGRVKHADSQMARLGFSAADTENALALMTAATRNPAMALKDLQVAADLARLKNISLADASNLVAKAQAGQTRGLKALGIDLPITAGGAAKLQAANKSLASATRTYNHLLDQQKHKTHLTSADSYALATAQQRVKDAQGKVNAAQSAGTSIVDALAKVTKGQAVAASETFAGKMAALKARTENLAAKIGIALIPIILKLVDVTMSIVGWMQRHKTIMEALGITLAVMLLPAIIAYTIEMGAAAIATLAATWPILAVAAVVGLLVYGVLELVKHWRVVWDFIKTKTLAAWNVIKPVLDAIWRYGLLPIRLQVRLVMLVWMTAWRVITTALSAAWSFMKPIFKVLLFVGLLPIIQTVFMLKHVWIPAFKAIAHALGAAWNFMRPIFHFIVSLGLRVVRAEVSALMRIWRTAWHAIETAISAAWAHVIKPIAHAIDVVGVQPVKKAIELLRDAWGSCWNIITAAINTAWSIIKPIIDAIKGALDAVGGALGKVAGGVGKLAGGVSGVAGKGLHMIGLADGGIVTSPTLAVIGEGKEPEAVIPLSKLARMGGGGGDVHVTVVMDGRIVHRSVQKRDKDYQRRNGGRSALAS